MKGSAVCHVSRYRRVSSYVLLLFSAGVKITIVSSLRRESWADGFVWNEYSYVGRRQDLIGNTLWAHPDPKLSNLWKVMKGKCTNLTPSVRCPEWSRAHPDPKESNLWNVMKGKCTNLRPSVRCPKLSRARPEPISSSSLRKATKATQASSSFRDE